MRGETDVLTVAMDVGKRIMAHAQGDPARTLAYGTAAAVAVAGSAVAYGTYVYAGKIWDYLTAD